MKKLLIPFILLFATPVQAQEMITINVNRVCANVIGIPYASDNFSEAEWENFKSCVQYIKQFKDVQ